MQKISISIKLIIVAIIISSNAVAQKMESYTYKMPVNIFEGGGKVSVKNFTNNGTEVASFGSDIAESILKALKNEGIGKVSDVKLYNPWLTTKLYEIVETDADFVISGDYKFTSASTDSYEEKWIAETSETVAKKLPICYYNYTASSNAVLEGKLTITKKDGKSLGSISINNNKSKSQTLTMQKPSIPGVASFYKEMSNEAITKCALAFSPTLVVEKYKFENIKSKNKELKGDINDMEKQIKNLLKSGEINAAGKKYLEIAAKEETEETNINIGICYEIIGNFTKAKEYYLKAADKSSINRINDMIAIRDQLSKLGIKIIENEL
ncbi:MAG: hypothetical protein AUJ97_06030 [Bacteroidetes bacterium CG2_30_32_10]|nr:MAG: hypothetical protein AUJ97_06030 [Bacteroidetes bacterium CG2_30_32_10]